MSEKIKTYKKVLEAKRNLRKVITKQINEHRKIHRRLESLIKTAEKKKYCYRIELVVVNDWVKTLLNKLGADRKENNKKIWVGEGLVEIARASQLLELIRQNPHIDY